MKYDIEKLKEYAKDDSIFRLINQAMISILTASGSVKDPIANSTLNSIQFLQQLGVIKEETI